MGIRWMVIALGVSVAAAPAVALQSAEPIAADPLGQAAPAAPAQGLPAPPPIEKALAARASNVTEVTLGKNMLAFAAKFMNDKDDEDEAATRKLIQGLDGVYVREYDFDKENEYTPDEVEQLRKYFETSDWTPVVRERSRRNGENTDVMVKLADNETHGMFILETEPKELTIVLILGPIHLDQLSQLTHIAGLGALGEISEDTKTKDKVKDKTKTRDGGTQ
jgi:hypothetical protein